MASLLLNETTFLYCLYLILLVLTSNVAVEEKCPPCSKMKGPCMKEMNYSTLNPRPDSEILLMLNLPFKVSREGIEDMTGDHRNGGAHYASAALVAVEDINRDKNLLAGKKLKLLYDPVLSDTECIRLKPITSLLKEIDLLAPDGYIGYKCNCVTIARILSAINRPLISHKKG